MMKNYIIASFLHFLPKLFFREPITNSEDASGLEVEAIF
jgi:hypothetical protein